MLRSRQTEGNALIAICLSVSWIVVCLRIYVRIRVSKCFGHDDWLLICALLLFSAYCGSALAAVYHGVGLDPSLIPKKDFPYAVMFWWLGAVLYNPTTLFVRLSISVFMHKICTQRTHKVIIWTTMGIIISYSIFYFFITVFQCNPPDYFWKKYLGAKGKCINENILPLATIVHSLLSALADWTLGLLPIWLIWGLQMNRRTKISIGILLGLGVFAGIAAIVRIPYVKTLGDDRKLFLYKIVDISLWSLAESALGFIAASCAALRPLFKKFYQLTTSGSRSRGYSNSRSRSLGNKLRSSSKSKSKSKSLTRSFGLGNSAGHGYATELHSNPSVAHTDPDRKVQSGVLVEGGRMTGADRKDSALTFYKSDDDSSIELGRIDDRSTATASHARGMGSEENLTGEKSSGREGDVERGMGDIHVHTLVEVTSGRHT